MIDRLHQTPPPLPPRPAAQESQPGVPSFLEWALSNPGSGSNSGSGSNQTAGGHADPQAQPAGLAQSLLAVPETIDPALALLPRNLPGDASQVDPRHAVPGVPVPNMPASTLQVPGLPAPAALAPPASTPSGLVPGDPSIAVSAVIDPQDLATHTLQVHLRKPQGEREVVSLPWRLAAGGRLDQSLRVPGAIVPPGTVSSMSGGGVSSANSGMAVFDALGRLQTPGVSSGARAPVEGALPPGMVRPALRAGDAPVAATLGAASAPVVSEWLSRWMKWIERDGRDPVVLLRDYRMDGDETRRVVDTLREFAREHGVVLDRVVVNGHEFWRNQNSDSTRE